MIRFLKTIAFAVQNVVKSPNQKRNIIGIAIFGLTTFLVAMIFAMQLEAVSTKIWWQRVVIFLVQWSFLPVTLLFLVLRHGEIWKRRKFERFFACINFTDFEGRVPEYKGCEDLNAHVDILRFRSRIPESEWIRKKGDIKMKLLQKILKMEAAKEDMRMMEIFVIKQELEQYIPWDDAYMEDGDVFAIGEGYEGKIFWKADSLHHGVVAGATSQGKTSLLRLLAYQAVKKKWNVEIIDMKQGGDYYAFKDIESDYGPMVEHDAKKVCEMLCALTHEVQDRLQKFDEVGVENIWQYNARNQDQFLNWLIIIDEAAELLDVRPKDKEEKQMYAEIEGYLRTLARTSRAAGVHLVFGYIRPSSDVLDGQIKNNLLWRVCGYFADDAASRIVLDNDKATELPPDVKGRFIIGEDEVQTYYLEPQAYEPKVWCR